MGQGGTFRDMEIFLKKSLTEPKKIEKGTMQSCRVLYVTLKGKNERVILCTNLDAFPLAGPVV